MPPNTTVSGPAPVHCAYCGLPLSAGPRCKVCGQSGARPPVAAPPPAGAAGDAEQSDTIPEMLDALNFFRAKNYAYYIPKCLNKLGSVSMPVDQPDGQFWNLT